MIITESQKKEIEALIAKEPEFVNALVAFGADMYRKGIIVGGIAATFGCGLALLVSKISEHNQKKRKTIKNKEES